MRICPRVSLAMEYHPRLCDRTAYSSAMAMPYQQERGLHVVIHPNRLGPVWRFRPAYGYNCIWARSAAARTHTARYAAAPCQPGAAAPRRDPPAARRQCCRWVPARPAALANRRDSRTATFRRGRDCGQSGVPFLDRDPERHGRPAPTTRKGSRAAWSAPEGTARSLRDEQIGRPVHRFTDASADKRDTVVTQEVETSG